MLRDLVKNLSTNLDATFFIVQHVSPHVRSFLPEILSKQGGLSAEHAVDGQLIEKNKVYVAPPDYHLILEKDRMLVRKGPKENRSRPAIDVLFRSAAYSFGPRVVAVLLSGMLSDGTSGIYAVKNYGGTCVVQDPEDAEFPDMPRNALEYTEADFLVTSSEIVPVLEKLVQTKVKAKKSNGAAARERKRLKTEIAIAAQDNAFDNGVMEIGELSPLTCPECNGALISIEEGKHKRYRCHTGHAFSPDDLMAGMTKAVEEDMWKAVRGLEETVMLLGEMEKSFTQLENKSAARQCRNTANQIRKRAATLRKTIVEERHDEEEHVNKRSVSKKPQAKQ